MSAGGTQFESTASELDETPRTKEIVLRFITDVGECIFGGNPALVLLETSQQQKRAAAIEHRRKGPFLDYRRR